MVRSSLFARSNGFQLSSAADGMARLFRLRRRGWPLLKAAIPCGVHSQGGVPDPILMVNDSLITAEKDRRILILNNPRLMRTVRLTRTPASKYSTIGL